MTIFFDMDGTIADLYAVEGWLKLLRAADATPYKQAAVMLDMRKLAWQLNRLQAKGYKLGIISWLSKESTAAYDEAVTMAKLAWLHKHLHSVQWDVVHIVPYGTPKQQFMETYTDILFDDEEKNRVAWNGIPYTPSEITEVLNTLLHGE